MSFTGNLEDLAIVDVIQLLHSARKSGTLCVNSGKRESQLVFDSGYIISARHSDQNIQIGKILVEMKALTAASLEQVLTQQQSETERKPLIGMLIESGLIDKDAAFKGLEILIEMTVVEMVSWTRGSFTLDVDNINASDEYRYFPETLHREMTLDTQMVLMDALRIYDEKKRDGEIVNMDPEEEELAEVELVDEPEVEVELDAEVEAEVEQVSVVDAGSVQETPQPELSADLLGLDDLDQLETKIPEVFAGLQAFDPADIHRQAVAQAVPELPADQREELAIFLTDYASSISIEEASNRNRQPRAVVLFSQDELLRHALMTVCKHEGVLVFVVRSSEELFTRIDQALTKGILPLMVFDVPFETSGNFSASEVATLRQQFCQRHRQIRMVQLIHPGDDLLTGQAYQDGVKAVFPRPIDLTQPETFTAEMLRFLEAFQTFVVSCFNEQGQLLFSFLNQHMAQLQGGKDVPAIAAAVLQFTAEFFTRALTLIVTKDGLVAERGIGLGSGSPEIVPAPVFKVPLNQPSVFRWVVDTGDLFLGPCEDALLREHLFATIGTPASSNVLLLPLQSRGRTISLTYADFGPNEPTSVVAETLEIFARHAGLVMENALYRRQLAKKTS